MKKILLSLFGLMLMFAGNVMAQEPEPEVTIDLTENDVWAFPTDYVTTEASYTNNGITLTFSAASNGHKYNATDKYVIFGKNDAAVTLSAFSFDVERIDVIGRVGASGKVSFNIFVGDDAVSTEVTGATGTANFDIAEGKQAAGTIYTIKNTNANNNQITKILVWKKGTTVAVEIPVVENIAAFNALEVGAKATLTLTEAQVIGAGNKNLIVKDASGSVCLYNTGLEYTLGQILNGTITGTVGEYKGYKQLANMTENDLAATEGTITPTVVTAAEAAEAALLSGPYKIVNAVVKKDGSNYYIMDGEEKVLQIYNQFKDANITLAEGTFDIEGIVGNYNSVQFWVTSFTKLPEELDVVGVETSCYVDEDYQPGGYHGITIDWDAIATTLGCTADALKIFAVLPDGTLDASYERGSKGTDGWRDADGNWAGWDSADNIFFVQFTGMDLVGVGCMRTSEPIAYTAIFKVVDSANENGDYVTLKVTLNVTEKEEVPLASLLTKESDLNVVANKEVVINSEVGKFYEGYTKDVDVQGILETIGAQQFTDAAVYAILSDGTLDENYKLGTTDGWRKADGDWAEWGDATSQFFVKADFSRATAQLYEVGGHEDHSGKHLTEPVTYVAKYAFAAGESLENHKAVILSVKLVYDFPTAISSVKAANTKSAIFNAAGQQLNAPQKGLNIIDGKKVYVK